eukprot:3859549-Prymnesium_polylepis.1
MGAHGRAWVRGARLLLKLVDLNLRDVHADDRLVVHHRAAHHERRLASARAVLAQHIMQRLPDW